MIITEHFFCSLLVIANENAWIDCSAAPLARTRRTITTEAGKVQGQANFSVKEIPIPRLPIDPDTPLWRVVVPDVLHADMRIGEKLMKESLKASAAYTGDPMATEFQNLIRALNVPFNAYPSKVSQGTLEVSSMNGDEWEKCLASSGLAIRNSSGIFDEGMKTKIADIFEEYSSIMSLVKYGKPSDAEEVSRRTRVWGLTYAALGFKFTPYLHLFTVHFAMSVKVFGGLGKLSGQWVEKRNSHVKRNHLQKTNHHNAKQSLLVELRMEHQEAEEQYKSSVLSQTKKRKATVLHPWQGVGVRELHKRRRQEEEEEREAVNVEQRSELQDLQPNQLREIIHARTGQRTRKQNHQSLLNIIHAMEIE